MKFLTILTTLFTTLAVAQNLEGQPACATSCIISAISAAGCAADDIGCQCGPSAVPIAASAGPCLLQACPVSDLITAESAGKAKCTNFYATVIGVQPTGQDNAATTTGTGATAANTGTSTSSAGAAAVMTAAPVLVGAAAVGVMGVLGAM
ncbi:hypothetical protein QBC40DRAFT_310094 [Triangularia verruculosa]|uniref:CFEM domain-containing protein n=1 Tax=Triangularia verruculosa TaxID=2587418 RepID=A0AAN7APB4_9PEZI|nr:hypothetical protein QBC40DRAFT_310094 [Triangularia verruculosa]